MINRYPPGSEWLYLRIYGGTQSLEEWLSGPFNQVLRPLLVAGTITGFHYIRYLDPDYHLRIRFKLDHPVSAGEILNLLRKTFQPFLDEELIWKTEVGTYEPETDRYGIDRIELAEQWFYSDSLFWLDKLADPEFADEPDRWKSCARRVHAILHAFSLSLSEISDLMKRMQEAMAAEYHLTRAMKTQLDSKYRLLSCELETALLEEQPIPEINLFTYYPPAVKLISDLKSTFLDTGKLFHSNLIPDLVHLTLNRAFRTRHRLQEMVLYDFMTRYYTSALARGKR